LNRLNRAVFTEWQRGFCVSLVLLVLTLFLIQSSRISSLLFSLSPETSLFLKTLLLVMPAWLTVCIPLAHIFASLTLVLRYRREGEIRAMQTLGMGVTRLLKPLTALGLLAAVATAFLSLIIEPYSKAEANRLVYEMAAVAAEGRIITGEIVQLTPDLTLYVQRRDGDRLENVFLAQNKKSGGERVLWAENAAIVKNNSAILLEFANGGMAERGQQTATGEFDFLRLRLPIAAEGGDARIFPATQTISSFKLLSSPGNSAEIFEFVRRLNMPFAAVLAGWAVILAAFIFSAYSTYAIWLFSLLLIASYYLCARLVETMAASGETALFPAAFTPYIAALAVISILILSLLRRRAP